jgi:hypothetical protein
MNKALYKFHFDAGRQGALHGLFIADPKDVRELIESKRIVRFGEVLGKHSDIRGPVEDYDLTLVTDDPEKIKWAEEARLCFGFDPFNDDEG